MFNKSTCHGGAALLLLAACATSDNEPRVRDAHVADAISALQGAVASCAEQRTACDNADVAACNESFASCRAAAQADNGPPLDRAVNECAEASRSCREAAQDAEAKAACTEQLKSCVGEDKPQPPVGRDGSADHPSQSPVAECITALRTCIEGDDPARECTSALQACVMAAVGNAWGHDGGKPDDPGNSGDAGRPDHADGGGMNGDRPDAGSMGGDRPDAGAAGDEHPPADAGKPAMPDAGMSAQAMACKAAYEQCIAGGGSKETCAQMNKDCRD